MFKRLFAVLLFAFAVSATPPAHASTLSVSLYCIPLGWGQAECHAVVSGGTGTYTSYVWTPTPHGGNGGDSAIIYCRPYTYNEILLTVTDSSGATGSGKGFTECGDAW